ncbi:MULTISPECIES: arylsulfotransferase family protein [Halococcus]|uniref:Arylsulfotransferase (ASST) n=1 Tax=Halococcus salifodinae DSM 8989 TaxID=1227456 RepID=M0N481_9EURY|nr:MULTISPECIES: arylsulfotransferase family protein [Halococcus]EMA52676.1 hypothetical protein C450_11283 [Halococcus salifodinae DSM 8989]
MRSLSRQRLGAVLILLAVVGVVGSFAVSAATTPGAGAGSANDSTDRGRTLVGMQAEGRVAMLDANGDPLWRIGSDNVDYFDVTMLDNGSVLAGFVAEGQQSCGPYESPCSRTGFRLIEPGPEPTVANEWSFPVRTKLNSEVHDVEKLPSGEYLLTDMEYERIFTVAENGSITWQWNASQHYDAPPDVTTTDWLHINDVDRIGDGRYMVSVRNANQLLVVERGEGVVDVINEDREQGNDANCKRNNGLADYSNDSGGDVLCGDPEVMDHQHNPQSLDDGAVLVADSENDRVIELHENEGEWDVSWGVDTSNGVRYDWPRDADRLPNGNTLITDSRNNRVVEVTPNGTTVWSADTGIWPYEAERLPYGELLDDNRTSRLNGSGDTPGRSTGSALPLVDQAYAGLSFVVSLPTWFQPWHIGVIAGAVVLTLVGGVLIVSGRWNR